MEEDFVQSKGLLLTESYFNVNSRPSQKLNPLSSDLRVRVLDRYEDIPDTARNNALDTGRSPSLMSTGFQIEIKVCTEGLLSGFSERQDLGVIFLGKQVVPFTDSLA